MHQMGQRWDNSGEGRRGPRIEMFNEVYDDATSEIQAIIDKIKAKEEITDEEKETLRTYMQGLMEDWTIERPERGERMWGEWEGRGENRGNWEWPRGEWRGNHEQAFDRVYDDASDEIKAIIDSIKAGEEVSDEDKETLKAYMEEFREAHKAEMKKVKEIMDKYKAGEEITDEEKAYVLENRPQRNEKFENKVKNNENISEELKAIMEKVANLETLTDDEKATLETHKEEREEQREARKENRQQVREIMNKYKDWQELSDSEKEFALENMPGHSERMDAQFENASDEIKQIVEKIKVLDTMTSEEREAIKQYLDENRPERWEARGEGKWEKREGKRWGPRNQNSDSSETNS